MATFTEEAVAANNALALAIDNIKRSIVLLQIENERLRATNRAADVTARALRFVLDNRLVLHHDLNSSWTIRPANPAVPPVWFPDDINRYLTGMMTMIELEAESAG